jgi:hypothetical protein
MQQGMLFHALAAPAAGIDVQQLVVELHEDIDESALTNAIKRLVNHHDVLRTRLTQDANGVYRQYVDAQAQVEIDIQDWSAMSAEAQRQRREEYLAADRSRGFRADSESFLRSAIIRCSERHTASSTAVQGCGCSKISLHCTRLNGTARRSRCPSLRRSWNSSNGSRLGIRRPRGSSGARFWRGISQAV